MKAPLSAPVVRILGQVAYEPTWRAMQAFSAERGASTADELWLLEHPPVYTLGQGGDARHLIRPNGVPLVAIDRGGQITYHGPGQLVLYTLLDIRRLGISVRELVDLLEQSIIDWLAGHGIVAARRDGAPGVYVGTAKIAALGLRIKAGRSYHGLSFNLDMDLRPFADINPCGFESLAVTQARDLGVAGDPEATGLQLAAGILAKLGYTEHLILREEYHGA